jgi:hypothetical protein
MAMKRKFWSALCDIAGSLSEIFESIAGYALKRHLLLLVGDVEDDCTRCAGTGQVGRIIANEGTLSERWLVGDWSWNENLTTCPSCKGTGIREYVVHARGVELRKVKE